MNSEGLAFYAQFIKRDASVSILFSEPCTASSYVDRSWPRGVMSPHAAKTPASLLRKIRASAASRFLCVVQEPTLPVWLRQKMSCSRVLCQNCKENAFCQNCVFSCFHSIEAVHDCMCEFLCPFRNTGRAVAEKVAQVLPPCVATPAGLFYAGVQGPLPVLRLLVTRCIFQCFRVQSKPKKLRTACLQHVYKQLFV